MNALQITAMDLSKAVAGWNGSTRGPWKAVQEIESGEIVGRLCKITFPGKVEYEWSGANVEGWAKTEDEALDAIWADLVRVRGIRAKQAEREAKIDALPSDVRAKYDRMLIAFQYWQAEEHRNFIREDDRAYTKAAYLKAVDEFEAAARGLAVAA